MRFPRAMLLVLILPFLPAAVFPAAPLEQQSESDLYTIVIEPRAGDIPIAERHAWTIEIRDGKGAPVEPTQLAFYGGMPGHGHGLPSAPRVTQRLEPGVYLVEGVVFNMYGEWDLVVGVVGPAGPDKAQFRLSLAPAAVDEEPAEDWSSRERAMMRSLTLPKQRKTPEDTSNRLLGRPQAISLGQALFFDSGLSLNGDLSCASCHDPRLHFTDGKKKSVGSRELKRNSPTLLGAAHGDWFYWDGRRDSVWSQALSPIETPGEMDNNRMRVVRYVLGSKAYRERFEELAGGTLPDLEQLPVSAGPYGSADDKVKWSRLTESQRRQVNAAFATVGKIIASYVATLEPGRSRFDAYVESLDDDSGPGDLFSEGEERGLRLFLSPEKTQCLRCHNGPYLTNFGFNNIGTGIPSAGQLPDFGRLVGLRAALVDEFNCLGPYSDADAEECEHHRFAAQNHADNGAFKVPTLRNVAGTGPYMHDGRFETLIEVLEFYRDPPAKEVSNHELPPLNLTDDELRDLAAFLGTLTSMEAD